MKLSKRFLSLALCVVLLLTCLPAITTRADAHDAQDVQVAQAVKVTPADVLPAQTDVQVTQADVQDAQKELELLEKEKGSGDYPMIIPPASTNYVGMKIQKGTSHDLVFKVYKGNYGYQNIYWHVEVYGGYSSDFSNCTSSNLTSYAGDYHYFSSSSAVYTQIVRGMFGSLPAGTYTVLCWTEFYGTYVEEWLLGEVLGFPITVVNTSCSHSWTNRVEDWLYSDGTYYVHYTCSKCGCTKCCGEFWPMITQDPVSVEVKAGETATFSVKASGESLSYQWQYKKVGQSAWTDWSGKTSSSVSCTAGASNDGCQYRCVVTNPVGSTTSNAATLTTVSVPTITTQPKNATVTIGESATFTMAATGKGTLTYQWQYKKSGETSWTNYGGATSTSFTVKGSATNGGCQYRCAVSNAAGTTYSNAATLTVSQVAKPTITTQPKNATVNLGESATFTVAASGTGLSYKWQYKKVGESSWTDYYGGTTASITVKGSNTNGGCQYHCVVSNAGGSVTSNAATLTVVTVAKPTITTQPKSATVALGESTTFKVVASGESLTYQWQYQKIGETEWTNYYGGTTASITVKGSNTNGGCKYHCVVSNAGGSVTSNAATLTVITVAKPTITTQPKSATVALGESTTFKVVASGESLTYQWQYQKVGETGWTNYYGGTTDSITVKGSNTNGGCQYHCVVSNAGGSVTSNAATLIVTTVPKPTITYHPQSVTIDFGDTMTFAVSAIGEGTLSYQWQYKKYGETDWTNWAGAYSDTFTVKGSATNNGCQYRCAVSNEGGTVYSDAATLTVLINHDCPGSSFTDMPPYGTVEHDAIDWALDVGVTTGTSDTTFSPNKTVTRGQAVTFLWRASGSPEPTTTTNPFTDVKSDSYCYKAVLWANENNITNGTTATTFSPNSTCNRGQILTFLYRQQGSPAVGSVTVPYTDIKEGAYYENAMKWAYANGIDKGVSTNKFAPNADCTRVSVVVFLYRAITGQGRIK